MSYFVENKLDRETYRNSLNLKSYFKKKFKGQYKHKCEYVVVWYEEGFYKGDKKSQSSVLVRFINLTEPRYINEKDGKEHSNFVYIKVPINYLHKIAIGSIWIAGRSNERFVLETYSFVIKENRRDLNIYSLYYANYNSVAMPIKYQEYELEADWWLYSKDYSQLLNVTANGYNFAIHPHSLYITHYGYSNEINRILSVYNWKEVEKKLCITENANVEVDNYIVMPVNFSHRDSIFLHSLKYDNFSLKYVRAINSSILLSKEFTKTKLKEKPKRLIKLGFWHNKSIELKIRGIRLGDTILCAEIVGISQPEGEDINIVLKPLKKRNSDEINSQNNQKLLYRTIVNKYEREHNFEQLDVSRSPVNNIIAKSIIERLETLGKHRKINKIQNKESYSINGDVTTMPYKEPVEFSVGDKEGYGEPGIANCFYNEIVASNESRFNVLWTHAKRLKYDKNATVHWYSVNNGFQDMDNFTVLSLENLHLVEYNLIKPEFVFVIRVIMDGETYYILDFSEKNQGHKLSGIVYHARYNEDFLGIYGSVGDSQFIKILADIVALGNISLGLYVDSYVTSSNHKIARFKHRDGVSNNWILNGIDNLRK